MANIKKTVKPAAKKTAKPVAKKAPMKKTTVKKASVSAKSSVKTSAKKPAAKKTPVKKAAVKKITSAKKATSKTPTKKMLVKKAVKPAVVKKTAAQVKKVAPAVKASVPAKKTAVKTVSDNKAMGRGLGALLSADSIPSNREFVVDLKLNDISPNDGQPRKIFKDESLNELAASIKEIGVIQPIIVQRIGEGYRIVAGERRWRAARIAGLSTIPAIVREDLSDTETMAQALIENILREDLNPIEEASAMKDLLVTHKLTQEKLANLLGKPRATIANTIRILNLDESLQEFVSRGDLSEGHAKVILGLKDKEDQRKVADIIMTRDLNVRQAEVFVKKYIESLSSPAKKPSSSELDKMFELSVKEVETKLKKQLGAKVKVKVLDNATGRGRIVIDYKDNIDLDRILEILCE